MFKEQHPRFDLLTKDFNVCMNDFIVTYNKKDIIDRYWTGGTKDIVSSSHHPFKEYCDFLEEFRDWLFRASAENELANWAFVEREFFDLLNFYKMAQIDNRKLWKGGLEPCLLRPLRQFFKRIDKKFNADFFEKKILEIYVQESWEVGLVKRLRMRVSGDYKQRVEEELIEKLWK